MNTIALSGQHLRDHMAATGQAYKLSHPKPADRTKSEPPPVNAHKDQPLLSLRLADLPPTIRSSVRDGVTAIKAPYLWFVSVWTDQKGFHGPLDANMVYAREHMQMVRARS